MIMAAEQGASFLRVAAAATALAWLVGFGSILSGSVRFYSFFWHDSIGSVTILFDFGSILSGSVRFYRFRFDSIRLR